jgi:phosphopantothenoylcysteine decarboxylase/phosphopantothenate--cysteine ligase
VEKQARDSWEFMNIILGVAGGIAAYKSPEIVRRLKDAGHEVRVVMTAGAEAFVTPLTFQAVSGEPVHRDLLDETAEAAMGHIELARWADVVLAAPATANLMARLAHGFADDLLTTLCLATPAPIVLAPAMNQQMWRAAATQANLKVLVGRGVRFIGPDAGWQACGDVGPGRMSEPADIVSELLAEDGSASSRSAPSGSATSGPTGPTAPAAPAAESAAPTAPTAPATESAAPLAGVRVLVTAGPTREAIDPVRFISNHSSGKMGFAVAAAARGLGAEVDLVSGPVALDPPPGVGVIPVGSAAEMHREVLSRAGGCDIFIATAAVADYTPAAPASGKLKKEATPLSLELRPTPDILAEVAALDDPPFTVGFAAETEDLERHARSKLERKGLDLIAGNRVGGSDLGFDSDRNALLVLWPDGGRADLPAGPKTLLARRLLGLVTERFLARRPASHP